MTTLIPAFVLSELKTAFIIGFVIFVPFLIIDLVVSSTLMSMGMFMLPPVLVSLPFKLLLFVMVDGWALVVSSLSRASTINYAPMAPAPLCQEGSVTDSSVIDIAVQSILLATKLAAPILGVSLAIGCSSG